MALPATKLGNQAARTILDSYNTENLRHSLMEYPKRIKEARQEVNQAKKAWKDAELERATLEAELILAISVETNEKGKPKYSNAEARSAELLRRKNTDPRYLQVAGKVAEAEAAFYEAQDTLQMLLDEYQSARIVARLIAGELGVISELADLEKSRFEINGQNPKEAF